MPRLYSPRRSSCGAGPRSPSSPYEPWAQPAIGRLEELRLAATEARIDADLATAGAPTSSASSKPSCARTRSASTCVRS